jgi:site-specific recombinase XerD
MTALTEPRQPTHPEPKPRRRDRGDDSICWDKTHGYYLGTISLGYDVTGKRVRRTVSGRTKTEVKDKLDDLRDEIKAGIRTPKNYTVEQCVRDWLDSLKLDPATIDSYQGQAEKWIYPKIGRAKLKDLTATELETFFNKLAPHLTKRSMVMIKSTLRRSIRRAQRHDLIGRNVAELIDLPDGRAGRPSRAMTQEQAGMVLATAAATEAGYTHVVKVGNYPKAATHAASPAGALACGNRPHKNAVIQRLGDDLAAATCRSCRAQLGLDGTGTPAARLEALFVVAITLGLRPGELRALTWDHVDLANAVTHVWKSARRGGDTKTPGSRRTLRLPQRAVTALKAHKKIQSEERLAAGEDWHDNNLVFCNPDGRPYTRDGLNYRFARLTRHAGIGHWHAHEGRHTAVSIMSSNGVPIQDIADTVGHKSTHVTETVYRHVIVPAIRGGAAVMDDVFGAEAAREVSAS